MTIRPFILPRARELQLVEERAARAVDEWSAGWGVRHEVGCDAAAAFGSRLDDAAWSAWRLEDGERVWLHQPEGAARAWALDLLGAAAASTGDGQRESAIAHAVAAEALNALVCAICKALCGRIAVPENAASGEPRTLLRYGAGAVVVSVGAGHGPLRLLVPADAVTGLAPARCKPTSKPLAALPDAIASLPLRLTLEVGSMALSIGHLATLAAGDVVDLGKCIEETLVLRNAAGQTVCHAHLGLREGWRAMRLIQPHIKESQ